MVAFHYPPCFGSSGVLRTLKFSRYLPGEGWDPVVLTANPRAYQAVNPAQLGEIPEEVEVARAFALDSRRHLAIRGKSLGLTAIPDQWSTWVAGAVPRGLRLLRRYRPEAIWSTYPIASAHLIGLLLHRLSGIPWVADFRDMMLDEAYPRARSTRLAHRWIERHVVTNAARLVFTAPSTEQLYLYRYPTLERARCQVIRNGYDEVDFADLSPRPSTRAPDDQPVRLVHSGLIYEEERDPRPFLRTLARLRGDGLVRAASLRVDLRASGSEERFRGLVRDMGLGEIVHLLPPLPYREALRDSADASALLILQGPSCDRQIPAKAYEYLRMGKPILGLTTRDGDTGRLLAECGGTTLLPLLDEEALYGGLPAFLDAVRRHRHPVPDPAATARYARQYQAKELAACLDQVAVGVGARST
ncbi:MAG TPA: glycosyltransferase [Methylomirabilota bacterium]|nr:glycosyltransferase [Methylomirabilota bacterium]